MKKPWFLQQENAPAHTSTVTEDCFSADDTETLSWPSRSSDLIPVENFWGVSARKVYSGGRKYSNMERMTRCVLEEWEQTNPNLLNSLIKCMQGRCIDVLQKNGGETKYWM